MELGTFRGLMTAILMALFVCLVVWAYSRRRDPSFAAASALPLEDDMAPPARQEGR
jgi:cytochrome c oxidase cbb3-type subunit 4